MLFTILDVIELSLDVTIMNSKLDKNILSQRGSINTLGTKNTHGTINNQIGTRGTISTQ